MNQWKKGYARGFRIETRKPSKIAKWVAQRLHSASRVVDAGCGQGRNSVYFAGLGHSVNAVDLVDLNFLQAVREEIRRRVRFSRGSVQKKNFRRGHYHAFVASRLIQYIPPKQLPALFRQAHSALTPRGGILALNFSHAAKYMPAKYGVKTFNHDPNRVKQLLRESGFEIIKFQKGAGTSKNTPYRRKRKSYDVLAVKR